MATDKNVDDEEVWFNWPRPTRLTYQISTEGRVRRWIKFTSSWKIITVKVRKAKEAHNRRRSFQGITIARAIAEAFLPGYAGEGPYEADHIDGNRLNDCATNIRWLSKLANSQNTLAEKGYSYDKKYKKFCPQIRINGVSHHLGRYDNEPDARQAYLRAKVIHHPSCKGLIKEKILPGPDPVKPFPEIVDIEGEIWKEVEWKKVPVMVSNKNRFKRNWKLQGWRLSPLTCRVHGRITCCVDGKMKQFHKLVAAAFIPNPNGWKYVRHIDKNFDNNLPENLAWMSSSEKTLRAYGKL